MATPSQALQRPVAFVPDAEADAQFNARRQRLMWRRRLLPQTRHYHRLDLLLMLPRIRRLSPWKLPASRKRHVYWTAPS